MCTANNCHDELDNLLSEMLLTVEALPDLSYNAAGKNKQITTQTTTSTMKRASASPIRSTNIESNTGAPVNINTSNDEKRSHVQRSYEVYGYSKNNNNNQDIGETSSITTTTLTPTESGRNTPALSEHQFKGYYNTDELYYDTDTQMQLHGKARYAHTDDGRKELQKRTENLLQNQSYSYMEVIRSDGGSRDRRFEESNIPYHAREYSKPFSYLPNTGDSKMLKMQSGLSSPSMVRKALNLNGNVPSGRKTPSQQDFAERTRYGRQYESKYTFGDKTPDSNLSVFDSDKLFRSENNKYKDTSVQSVENNDSARYFEPLRRSNTMDGSFGRSGYASDG
jgi:hypothetical protein